MKFYSDVIMWTLTFALPCATLGLPVPSSSYGSPNKEHPTRTMLSSSLSSFFLSFLRPSLSSSSSVSSSVSSTTSTGTVMFEWSGTSVARKRRAAKVPQSMEAVISGVQQKAGTDLKASDSADLVTPSPRPRHNRRNRGSKKRPKSKKRRRRRKCPKKNKKQRRRKHRKCSRSRKSRRRNGKKRRNRKHKKVKSEKREKKKKRRQVTKDTSVNFVSEKPEIVKNQKVVKPEEANPRDLNSTKVAVLFDKASPLEHLQQKEQKPARISHETLASVYDSSRPLSANHFTNIQHNKNPNGTISSSEKHSQISQSKQERFKRSTVLLKRLPPMESGSYSNSDGTDVLSLSSNEKTSSMLKAVSNFLRKERFEERTFSRQIHVDKL